MRHTQTSPLPHHNLPQGRARSSAGSQGTAPQGALSALTAAGWDQGLQEYLTLLPSCTFTDKNGIKLPKSDHIQSK